VEFFCSHSIREAGYRHLDFLDSVRRYMNDEKRPHGLLLTYSGVTGQRLLPLFLAGGGSLPLLIVTWADRGFDILKTKRLIGGQK
jgi:hypothetical protein